MILIGERSLRVFCPCPDAANSNENFDDRDDNDLKCKGEEAAP